MTQASSAIEREALLASMLNGAYPDARGRFGPFGGRYVPETLVPALDRLQAGVDRYLRDPRVPRRVSRRAARAGSADRRRSRTRARCRGAGARKCG